jgi:hypothetical protein
MIIVKKTIIVVLTIFTINFFHLPYVYAKTDALRSDLPITVNQPEMMATAEETLPVETVTETGFNKWIWISLGVLAVGTVAAMATGGSSDDDRDGGTSTPAASSGDGNVQVNW